MKILQALPRRAYTRAAMIPFLPFFYTYSPIPTYTMPDYNADYKLPDL